MPRSNEGHKYILYIIDEVTNYLIMILIHQSKSEEIGDAQMENIITKYCVSDYTIMDQDSAFMSSLMKYLFKKLDIKIKTVAPYNHQLLQAEHGTWSLSTILMKHLTNLGQIWPKYLTLAAFNSACNEVPFNKKAAIMKENLRTKYFPITYNDITLNKKLPTTKENLCIFFHYRQG